MFTVFLKIWLSEVIIWSTELDAKKQSNNIIKLKIKTLKTVRSDPFGTVRSLVCVCACLLFVQLLLVLGDVVTLVAMLVHGRGLLL